MGVIDERGCASQLLDDTPSIETKASLLSDYLQWHALFGQRMGLGRGGGRSLALERLVSAAPPEHRADLIEVLNAISKHNQEAEARSKERNRHVAAELRTLKPGTTIEVRDGNRETTAVFIQMRRSRFVFEYSDGRRFAAPVQCFLRVAGSKRFERLSDSERARRDLVRALGPGKYEVVKSGILRLGAPAIPSLLDELEAARLRVENAPVGISKGAFAAMLGPARQVNPHDQSLIKRIPRVVVEIAERIGKRSVIRQVRKHASKWVRQKVLSALGDA